MDIFSQDKWTLFELAAYTGDFSSIKMPPARFSATTTKKHIDCNRKFYWDHVVGIDTGPTAAQAFGTRGHKASEIYLKTGEKPHTHTIESTVALAGVPFMPKPFTPGLKVEESFTVKWALPNGDIINVTGTADATVEPQDKGDDTFDLYDHKFIKDMKWAMSKGDLANDVQANLYAHVFFERHRAAGFKELEYVNKTWIYYQKTPQKDGSFLARPTTTTSTRTQVAHIVNKTIEPAFEGMNALRQEKPRLFDVPYNSSACNMFGGCPHRQRCFGPKAVDAKIGQHHPDRIDNNGNYELSNCRWATAAEQAANRRTKTEVRETMGIISRQAAAPQTQQPAQQAPITKGSIVAKAAAAIRTAPTAINPPAPEQGAPVVVPEAPKRTRRTKAEMEAAAAGVAITKELEEVPVHTDDVRKRALGYNAAHGYWLFVGCAPTHGFTGKVHGVAELTAQAALDANVLAKKEAHYRMEFGGHGLLQAAFDRWMTEHAITGAVVIPAGSVAGQNVIDSLRVHASLVVERTGMGA